MSLTNITPSTGRREAVSINLNALRVRPGDVVVYWSKKQEAVAISSIDTFGSDDGNRFMIDDENIFVTSIYAKLPRDWTLDQARAIRDDFASFGREIITGAERLAVRDRHGL